MIINLQAFIHPISLFFFSPRKCCAVAADKFCRRGAAETRGASKHVSPWFKRLPALLTLFFGSMERSLPGADRSRPNHQLEQTERNQIINKDGIARRVLATGTALSNETSPEELCERMAAFSPVRPDLTSLLAERKKPFTVIAVNMDEKNKNTNYRSIYKQRPDYMTLD